MNVTLEEVLKTIPKEFYSGKVNIRLFDGQSESLVDIDSVVLRNNHKGKTITLVAAGSSVASKADAVEQEAVIVASPNAEKEADCVVDPNMLPESGIAGRMDPITEAALAEPVRIKRVYRKRN